MEKVFKNHLVSYLESCGLMNENQHGFRAKRSMFSQLVQHVEEILLRLEDGANVDVIYLDRARAFDKVDHSVLLAHLKSLGVSGNMGIWIHQFLTGRKQFVSVGNEKSNTSDIISGVPQGTVLGPVLFLVLLTSIDANVSSFTSSFADYTKLVGAIPTALDAQGFQRDLDSVYDWANKWNMSFNGDKFQLL